MALGDRGDPAAPERGKFSHEYASYSEDEGEEVTSKK
jgi:hypothetical protein